MFHQIRVCAMGLTVLTLGGCGTMVGNPTGGGSKPTSAVRFPHLALAVPDAVREEPEELGLNLQRRRNPRFTSLHRRAQRITQVYEGLNQTFNELNEARVVLDTPFKLPGSPVSGIVRSGATDDGAYAATLCVDEQPFLSVTWSKDGSLVEAVRDFARRQGRRQPARRAARSSVRYRVTGDVIEATVRHQGDWPGPRTTVDGRRLYEVAYARQDARSMTLRMVSDWQPEGGATEFRGDSYLVGQLARERGGRSSFVEYRRHHPLCRDHRFVEDDPRNFDPAYAGGFCLGRVLGEEAPRAREQRRELLAELATIGVASATTLSEIDWPAASVCPVGE